MTIDPTSEHSHEALPLGPAVSRPGRMPPQVGGADDPIPPFSPGSVHPDAPAARTPEAESGGASGGAPGADVPEHSIDSPEDDVDLTWLDGIDWGDEASAEPRAAGEEASDRPPVTEGAAADQAESETLPPWISWVEEEGEHETEVHEVEALVEDYGQLRGAVAKQLADFAASVQESIDAAPAAGATGRGAGEDASSAALREVADRLEDIAASLRGKTIADLLGETSRADPLELLITGFVLGTATRRTGDR